MDALEQAIELLQTQQELIDQTILGLRVAQRSLAKLQTVAVKPEEEDPIAALVAPPAPSESGERCDHCGEKFKNLAMHKKWVARKNLKEHREREQA